MMGVSVGQPAPSTWKSAFLVMLICLGNIVNVSSVIVSTMNGRIRGQTNTFLDKQIQVFLGVPYAKAPIRELRFQKPQLPDSWDGIYDATSVKDSCMQARNPRIFPIPTQLSEDCLYLNVWTPNASEGADLPVLVWFHGGIFKIGSAYESRYNATALSALNNVVVVTCNFRLSIFGYLDLESENIPGNVGLWDQLYVLQWVQDNIFAFGGDPNLVTAFGESSGAMSVHNILLSPYSSGLFRRIFLMSGTESMDSAVDSVCESTMKGNAAAKALDCAGPFKDLENHPEVVLDCLLGKSALQVSEAAENVTAPKVIAFLPTFGTEFLPELQSVVADQGRFRPVDAMVSVTANEGAFAFVLQPDTELLWGDFSGSNRDDLKNMLYEILSSWLKEKMLPLAEVYLNAVSPRDNAELRQAVADFIGNHYFYCPSRFFAELHTAKGGNVYPFVFGHRSQKSDMPEWIRNTHMEDIPYVLGTPFLEEANYTEDDRKFSAFIMKAVVSFAKEGKPIPPDGIEQWPVFSNEHPDFLWLEQGNSTVMTDFINTTCRLWRNFL
ncbi:cholinesterase-like [Dermacentor variabilis]|uniref:cholinesterase-like n=1 Tax=Dermacentor variabilis TaxID=34621 RepID=UPI003F5C748D